MNNREMNFVRMVRSVLKLMTDKAAMWNFIPALVAFYNLLISKLAAWDAIEVVLQGNTKGITRHKKLSRNTLIESILSVTGAVRAYATAAGDVELFSQMNIKKGKLTIANATALLEIAKGVYDTAILLLPVMGGYNIDAATMATFDTRYTTFKGLAAAPRAKRSEFEALRKESFTIIADMRVILNNEMDSVIETLRFMNPTFYAEYHNARKIEDLAAHGTELKGTVKDSHTSAMLKKAVITVLEQARKRITNADGNYRFKRGLLAGIYTIEVKLRGYRTLILNNINLIAGRMNDVDVNLERE